MRRRGLHILFWGIYFFQDMLMHYTWMEPYLPGVPGKQQLWMATRAAAIVLVPKMLLSYFVMYRTIPRLLDQQRRSLWTGIELFIAVSASIIALRALFYLYITPRIYFADAGQMINIRSFLITIMEVGFPAGVAGALKLLRIQLRTKDREKSLARQTLEAELKFLRHQTNPHFLFNTLNNIYSLSLKNAPETPGTVMKLSKMLRFMLYDAGDGPIRIGDEVKLLDTYIELEQIRYTDSLSVVFNRQIDDEAQQIEPLLLLPLVENAFKHGASEAHFDSFIHINMKLDHGQLSFHIENTKEESGPAPAKRCIGIGNVKRQLELMYKEQRLEVKDQDNLFSVTLDINLNSHGNI